MDSKLLLGEINGVFGVQGWVKVFSDTKPRENIFSYRKWFLAPKSALRGRRPESGAETIAESDWVVHKVVSGRLQGKNVIVRIEGVNDRNGAEALIGSQIAISRAELPTLANDEYYWSDLIGFSVHDAQGVLLGKLIRMFETGANDVMVVGGGSREEILIPWIRGPVIKKIDAEEGLINVDWDPDY